MAEYTLEELLPYFKGDKKGMYHEDSCKKYKEFLPHSDGVYPKELIELQRPNEPDVVKEYREKIWQPISQPPFSKILSSLGKIRRSSDWGVKYPKEEVFSRIAEGEELEAYMEKNFPHFGSATNWLFSAMLKPYAIDSNAVVVVELLNTEVEANKYVKPFPFIYCSFEVIEFLEDELAIIVNPEGCIYYHKGKAMQGKSYFVITPTVIEQYDQIDNKMNFALVSEYQHGLPEMPAFKVGGLISKSYGLQFCYESRLVGVLPNLNEAIAEYTDLQAGKRLHIYPERWEYTQHECNKCVGIGKIANPIWKEGGSLDPYIECGQCGGRGLIATGPYSKILVKANQAGENPVPTPPAGYVEKDVEIIRIMTESIKQHIYDALSSINFQFLDQVPLNQSGTAKEVDKEELNNTVHAIAEDLVKIMDRVYRLCAYYRYKAQYRIEEIDKMVPAIAVPEHYDLLSAQFMQKELGEAKKDQLNPLLISAMEVEFTGKRFINEPEVKGRLELILKLDPLPNISEENKMVMLSNKGITLETYIISSNIQSFIQRALDEDDLFSEKELKDQKATLVKYAQEQIEAQSVEKEVIGEEIDPEENPEDEVPEEEDVMA